MKTKEDIELLFKSKGIIVTSNLITKFQEFVDEKSNIDSVNIIIENQMRILKSWKIKNRIIDITNQQIILPNALIGVSYKAKIDIEKFNLKDLIISDIEGLTDTGLTFDATSLVIEGIPIKSGDLKLKLLYKLKDEAENSVLNAKIIPLFIGKKTMFLLVINWELKPLSFRLKEVAHIKMWVHFEMMTLVLNTSIQVVGL